MFEKIKAFFQARSLIQEAKKEVTTMDNQVKPGWKTTEFWGTHLTQIISLVAMLLALKKVQLTPEQQTGIVTAGVAVIGAIQAIYTLVRGWVKSSQPIQMVTTAQGIEVNPSPTVTR